MNTLQTDAETELGHSEEILHPVNARYHGQNALPGVRLANAIIGFMGSWPFLIIQTIICSVWIALNVVAWFRHFDPYPFILLNLAFSTQAAYAAPLILMASNVAGAKDRELWESDYATNQKAYENRGIGTANQSCCRTKPRAFEAVE